MYSTHHYGSGGVIIGVDLFPCSLNSRLLSIQLHRATCTPMSLSFLYSKLGLTALKVELKSRANTLV